MPLSPEVMEIIATHILLGLIPAITAVVWRGRPFFRWWLYGALIPPVALIHLGLLRPRDDARTSPTTVHSDTRGRRDLPHQG